MTEPTDQKTLRPSDSLQFDPTETEIKDRRTIDYDDDFIDYDDERDVVFVTGPGQHITSSFKKLREESDRPKKKKKLIEKVSMDTIMAKKFQGEKVKSSSSFVKEEFEEMKFIPGDNFFNAVAVQNPVFSVKHFGNHVARAVDYPFLDDHDDLIMYWTDVFENRNEPGSIYLFGKVQNPNNSLYESCCVKFTGVNREIVVVPNSTDASSEDIEKMGEEIDQLCADLKINLVSKRVEKRQYHFDTSIIERGVYDCLILEYSFTEAEIPEKFLKGNTYSHIFGVKREALEIFIIKNKIMGPCWVRLPTPDQKSGGRVTWCKYQCDASSPVVSVVMGADTPPEPTVVVLSLKIYTQFRNNVNEIVAASGVIHDHVHVDGQPSSNYTSYFTLIRKLQGCQFPEDFDEKVQARGRSIKKFNSERALLDFLTTKLFKVDPDVIVGHNFLGYDLDILLHRMKKLNIDTWSRLGRLRRSRFPRLQKGPGGVQNSTANEIEIMCGRLVCDVFISAQEFGKGKNFKLSTLAKKYLDTDRVEINFDNLDSYYLSSNNLIKLCDAVTNDAYLSLAVTFNMTLIPLTKLLSQNAGNPWSVSLSRRRAERVDYLLMHSFSSKSPPHITPDPINFHVRGKKGGYSGGLVLDPKVGFYDNFVIVLDFNSLYPSIIQEYNICFTTSERILDEEGNWVKCEIMNTEHVGVIPDVIRVLVEKRKAVKNILKSTDNELLKKQYNIRQLALKLIANSMYGCLGSSYSRFCALPIAEYITTKGREALLLAENYATNKLNLNVIYGDTDSIMVATPYMNTEDLPEVKKVAHQVKTAINRMFKELELDVEGIFKNMLLLKKKKYAALMISSENGKIVTKQETKGLDLVRRDVSAISADAGHYILDQIFSQELSRDDVIENILGYLKRLSEDMREGNIDIEKYIITKRLTKDVEKYDLRNQPHAKVAKDLLDNNVSVQTGDYIQYVICLKGDDEKGPLAEKAFDPKMVEADGRKIDVDWYLKRQVLAQIERLLNPIEGIDKSIISESLGIEYHYNPTEDYEHMPMIDFGNMVESKYADVERLVICCTNCEDEFEFEGFEENKPLMCPTCSQYVSIPALSNKIILTLRKTIMNYNKGIMRCSQCTKTSKKFIIRNHTKRCFDCGGKLNEEISPLMVHQHIRYLHHLVTTHTYPGTSGLISHLEKLINKNKYDEIDLSKIFSFM